MKSIFLRFVFSLSVYSLVIISVGFVAFNYLLSEYSLTIIPYVLICLFFYAVTLIVHYVLLKSSEKKDRSFVHNFIVTTFLKLSAYLVILVICILLNRENTTGFIILFLALYLFYTVFETIALVKFFKKRF